MAGRGWARLGHDDAGSRKILQKRWIGTAIANLPADVGARRRLQDGARAMSTFDNPFDPERRLSRGCVCGRHRSQAEHDEDARRQLHCTPAEQTVASEEKRYQGVVASAAMRAVFPAGRSRRAFWKSVRASTALAARSHLLPPDTATH